MAQVLNQLRQREGATVGVVAEFGCGHHYLGVGGGALQVGRIEHPAAAAALAAEAHGSGARPR